MKKFSVLVRVLKYRPLNLAVIQTLKQWEFEKCFTILLISNDQARGYSNMVAVN